MTKDRALQAFFETFMGQITDDAENHVFPSTNVIADAVLPYLTYEYIDSDFGDGEAAAVVNLWFRTESEAVPNEAVRRFRKFIEEHDWIPCDDGYIWIKSGSPFAQGLADETDPFIKRRYINITYEYLTR